MKLSNILVVVSFAATTLAVPIPDAEASPGYGEKREAAPIDYGSYPQPAGGYGSYPEPAGGYGSYEGVPVPTTVPVPAPVPAPKGGYGDYPAPAGGYGSYPTPPGGYASYKRTVVGLIKRVFG